MKLSKRGQIRYVGSYMEKESGSPRKVFCNGWRPPVDTLPHEIMGTRFLLKYDLDKCVRGYDVDKRTRADAEIWMGGRKYLVEIDTGKVKYRRIQARWRKYRGVEDFLLVVTSTEDRMKRVIEHSSEVAGIALFTTLDKALDDPYGVIWVDCFGKEVALPKC